MTAGDDDEAVAEKLCPICQEQYAAGDVIMVRAMRHHRRRVAPSAESEGLSQNAQSEQRWEEISKKSPGCPASRLQVLGGCSHLLHAECGREWCAGDASVPPLMPSANAPQRLLSLRRLWLTTWRCPFRRRLLQYSKRCPTCKMSVVPGED